MSCPRELHELDPNVLSAHFELLYRVARRLCGSHEDAEDLVQDTLAAALGRPRLLYSDDARGYLLRALRNTQASQYRAAMCRPTTVPLVESDLDDHLSQDPPVGARELMEAILSAPKLYRDAVLAVDVVGLSYRQAAHRLRTREETIASRLHRGRRYVRPLIRRAIATGAES
jgi:RNA polymerase sigma-70 factor (ECF subfamily)